MGFFFGNKQLKVDLNVIHKDQHKIDVKLISFYALKVIRRLKSFGYEGYIVGGAVRDLLLGKIPKDFDVVTDATPNQVKKIFMNSRIIGKRFRLVHVWFHDAVIETATFRTGQEKTDVDVERSGKSGSGEMITRDNCFGHIEDDVIRRDFSLNALYYDPEREVILDYIGGYNDISNRIVRSIRDNRVSLKEDPVRMLRAVKYACLLDCTLEKDLMHSIKKYSRDILKCSVNRLYEEINKIFKSSRTADVFCALNEMNLLKYLIPDLHCDLSKQGGDDIIKKIRIIDNLDKKSDFNYELYWVCIFYTKVKIEYEKTDSSLTLFDRIKGVVSAGLNYFNTPRKVIDDISKAFYIYFRYGNKADIERVKRFKSHNSLNILLRMLEFFNDDKTLFEELSPVINSHGKLDFKTRYKRKKKDYKNTRFIRTIATNNSNMSDTK